MRVLQFQTMNSIYEYDVDGSRIRRLSGNFDPTPRLGVDGEWQHIEGLKLLANETLLIIYRYDGPIARCTVTSPVVATKHHEYDEHLEDS